MSRTGLFRAACCAPLLIMLGSGDVGALTERPAPRGAHGLAVTAGPAGACVLCHADGRQRLGRVPGLATSLCLGCHDGAMATDVAATMTLAGIRLAGAGGSADHPVGVPLTLYSGQVATEPGAIDGLNRAVIDGEVAWWIDTEAVPNGQRDETDLILFTRTDGGPPAPYVECATCHDPHDDASSGRLRSPNTQSRLCRACHDA